MTSDPLAIVEAWPSEVPLIPLEQALEQSLLQSGLSRQDYIKRLVQDLHKPRLQRMVDEMRLMILGQIPVQKLSSVIVSFVIFRR